MKKFLKRSLAVTVIFLPAIVYLITGALGVGFTSVSNFVFKHTTRLADWLVKVLK